MINCPEEASAPGIKPERFVRRSETMEFHHASETTEFQYEGRGHATSDILDIPLPAIYARISKMGNPASRSVIGICVLHGAVPVFHLRAHHKARQESKAVSNDCSPLVLFHPSTTIHASAETPFRECLLYNEDCDFD